MKAPTAVEDQCTDRCYRIGQHRRVTVHLPLAILPGAEARSFDRNLHALLQRKRMLAADLLAAPAANDAEQDELLMRTIGA